VGELIEAQLAIAVGIHEADVEAGVDASRYVAADDSPVQAGNRIHSALQGELGLVAVHIEAVHQLFPLGPRVPLQTGDELTQPKRVVRKPEGAVGLEVAANAELETKEVETRANGEGQVKLGVKADQVHILAKQEAESRIHRVIQDGQFQVETHVQIEA